MYFPEDELIAQYLQNEFNLLDKSQQISREKENENPSDSILELSDPTPSIHDLFVKFDKKFFWGTLGMVQILWSNRMTKCAGMCYFEGRQGLCKISLSAPLLSLRPRKDLVETLLHEMIHAYLFVTNNYRDRDDHGAEFHKHMFRINRVAGTNISVYHKFYNEVEYYQRHIWRCNGPCRYKKPYFGFLKRSMNRAPGPHDSWWNQHKMECNGTFIKVSEPEKKPSKKLDRTRAKKPDFKSKNIRDLFHYIKEVKTVKSDDAMASSNNPIRFRIGETSVANVGNDVINSREKKIGNDSETKGAFARKDENRMDRKNGAAPIRSYEKESVQLQGTNENVGNVSSEKVREVVRNVWSKKFLPKSESQPRKKIKIENSNRETCESNRVAEENKKDDANSTCSNGEELSECPVCSKKVLPSEMKEHLEMCLQCTFANEKMDEEINCDSVPCPCCYKWFLESEMDSHIDECLTLIALKEENLNF